MIPILLAAALSCGELKPPEIGALAGKDTKVTLALEKTSLDRVFKALGEQAGFRVTFRGFTPVVTVHQENLAVEQVLGDLARQYGLLVRADGRDRLEVKGAVASGVGGVSPPVGKDLIRSRPEACPATGGKVVLLLVVCEDGHVAAVSVAPGTEDPAVGACLVETVRGMTFEPARKDGKPVAVSYTLTVQVPSN